MSDNKKYYVFDGESFQDVGSSEIGLNEWIILCKVNNGATPYEHDWLLDLKGEEISPVEEKLYIVVDPTATDYFRKIFVWNATESKYGELKPESGKPPEHKWQETELSFKNPDGSWGSQSNLGLKVQWEGTTLKIWPAEGGEEPEGVDLKGNSIISIEKTSTDDNIDTYTITFTDETTTTFTVANGIDGAIGPQGIPGDMAQQEAIDQLNNAQQTKLDKLNLGESTLPQAYIALPNGAQGSKTITSESTADSLALRDVNGRFQAENPSAPKDVVNYQTAQSLTSVYDLVIKTQAEFEEMITDGRTLTNANIQSSTWKGAKSVALVGEFVLDFAGNEGVKRPSTVTRIDGFNNAKITVTNFAYKLAKSNGGLYDSGTGSAKCRISDLTIDCTGTDAGYCFSGNNNTYTNCTGTGYGTGLGSGYGFNGNNNTYTNCTGTGAGYNGYGFNGNNNTYTNCTGAGTGNGFFGNNNIYTNCTGTGNGTDSSGSGGFFGHRNTYTICTGAGTNTSTSSSGGYGFLGDDNTYTICTGTGTSTSTSGGAGYGFSGYNNRIISCTALAYVSDTPNTAKCVPISNTSTSANLFMIIKNCKFPQIAKAGYNQGTIWCSIANNTTMKGAIKDNIYHSRFTDAVIAGAGVEQENNQAVDITEV